MRSSFGMPLMCSVHDFSQSVFSFFESLLCVMLYAVVAYRRTSVSYLKVNTLKIREYKTVNQGR